MPDNEIIKALEICTISRFECDESCPLFGNCGLDVIAKYALDIINRQKDEIERLKHHCFGIQNELEAYKDTFNTATDEAIKEFAARLKEKADRGYWQEHFYVDIEEIDNLVKEMTESEGKDNA